jgi:hypothetical protein
LAVAKAKVATPRKAKEQASEEKIVSVETKAAQTTKKKEGGAGIKQEPAGGITALFFPWMGRRTPLLCRQGGHRHHDAVHDGRIWNVVFS